MRSSTHRVLHANSCFPHTLPKASLNPVPRVEPESLRAAFVDALFRRPKPRRVTMRLYSGVRPAAVGHTRQPVQIFRRFDVELQSPRERVENLCGWMRVTALLES